MSVPPSSRTQARSSRFRLREILWLLSAIILLLLLGMNVAPESWLQRVRVPRTEWSAPRPEKAPSPDSTEFSPEGATAPVKNPTPVDSQEEVTAKPPKPAARGVAQ